MYLQVILSFNLKKNNSVVTGIQKYRVSSLKLLLGVGFNPTLANCFKNLNSNNTISENKSPEDNVG